MKHVVSAATARTCHTCTTLTHVWAPVARGSEPGRVDLFCPSCARKAGHLPARQLAGMSVDDIAAAITDTFGTVVPELTDEEWDAATERWADLMDPNVYGVKHAAMLAVAHIAAVIPSTGN